ncbi:MAG: hypothetical protein QE278_03850 [Limnobacter sp.]|nr:hypothetical protein [Limnobacter sp.]
MKLETLFNPTVKQPVWAVLSTFAVCLALAFPPATLAGPGHDHGDEHSSDASSSEGSASPRFVISSDLFEAVGIVKGKTIEIFIDHANTNAPVENATLELELNGNKVPVELHAVGEFDAVLPEALTKEHSETPISVAMTITAGDQVDLLAGELTLAHNDEHHAEADAHSHGLEYALYGLAALLLLGLVVFGLKWRKKQLIAKGGK